MEMTCYENNTGKIRRRAFFHLDGPNEEDTHHKQHNPYLTSSDNCNELDDVFESPTEEMMRSQQQSLTGTWPRPKSESDKDNVTPYNVYPKEQSSPLEVNNNEKEVTIHGKRITISNRKSSYDLLYHKAKQITMRRLSSNSKNTNEANLPTESSQNQRPHCIVM